VPEQVRLGLTLTHGSLGKLVAAKLFNGIIPARKISAAATGTRLFLLLAKAVMIIRYICFTKSILLAIKDLVVYAYYNIRINAKLVFNLIHPIIFLIPGLQGFQRFRVSMFQSLNVS
jgi:hypothetical protein